MVRTLNHWWLQLCFVLSRVGSHQTPYRTHLDVPLIVRFTVLLMVPLLVGPLSCPLCHPAGL